MTSRSLARELIAQAGCPDAAIGRRADGAPIWPAGVSGSFSYKEEWCAVAVASGLRFSSLGIDLERFGEIPRKAWTDIVSPRELRAMSPRALVSQSHIVNLAFTAKEAYFKAQCSVTGDADLEFREVELAIDWTDGRLSLGPLPTEFRAVARLRWNVHWCVAVVALLPAER